ncbi:restriction endonuclease [Nocardia beijingensis]|uniref:restriction endonuclease n=1 Tax=Nocardia beijingensis TaxID=95162 RepID=UPI002B4B62F8|nr:restriction endonuclease [Nocardia beijingensis]
MTYGTPYHPQGGYSDRQTAQQLERERKAWQRQQEQAAAADRDAFAAAETQEIELRIAELKVLLRSSLGRDPRIEFASLYKQVEVPPLALGALAFPTPAPVWSPPVEPTGMARIFGGQKRYEEELLRAKQQFAEACEQYRLVEADRERQVAQKRQEHREAVEQAERWTTEENARVDDWIARVRSNDRLAVSEYLEMVLRESPYPSGFPNERRAAYVPESSRLVVQWYLPSVEVVPEHMAYRHIKSRRTIEPTIRPVKEIRRLYQSVIAQIALRTVREIFATSSEELISTVVFNGLVRAVSPETGQPIEPPLISMRATRDQFAHLILDEPKFDPVACVRKHFFADVSAHPDELVPVEPVMTFDMADPRIVDPVDVISELDKRPNLLDLTPSEFEAFIQNLFTRMGFDTKLFKASGDRGVDCVAYDPHPITGGKFIVQAKLYTHTVKPTHVRDLWGTVQHEGATKGIMITTSGYGPESEKFANGKPLNLIDGTGLLSLCQQHGIPARIVNTSRRAKPESAGNS